MSDKLQILLKEIRTLEKAVEEELHRVQKNVTYNLTNGKVSFPERHFKIPPLPSERNSKVSV